MPEPVVIATWPFGRTAVEIAFKLLAAGKPALDGVVAGAQAVEDDLSIRTSVGFGSLPDAVGRLTLDACVMDGKTLNCGAVAGLEHIRHPAAVAKKVMETTPHVLLVGEGAKWFALENGFKMEMPHTAESIRDWYARHPKFKKKDAKNAPPPDASDIHLLRIDEDNHDTVTVLGLDQAGHLGGVCTTSGLAYKRPGRVGDSPIIGCGLYVDDEAGAAGATGTGEEVIRITGSAFVVDQMRAGKSPQEAAEAGVRRVNATAVRRGVHPAEVAFIALNRKGEIGAATTIPLGKNGDLLANDPNSRSFQYAVCRAGKVELIAAKRIGPETK